MSGTEAPSKETLVRLPEGARIVRAQDEAIAAALRRGDWDGPTTLLKREGDARTIVGDLRLGERSRRIALKRIPERPGLKRFVHRALAISPALRQWRGATLLAARGVPVSTPLLLARGGEGGVACEWLALSWLAGEDALGVIDRMRRRGATPAQEHALADALGGSVRMMARVGVRNRDHKLSNLIVMEGGGIGVIDSVGVSRGRAGERRMLLAMLKEGAGVGLLPRRALRMRVLRAAVSAPKSMWRALADDLARASDTTPRVDPLRHAR